MLLSTKSLPLPFIHRPLLHREEVRIHHHHHRHQQYHQINWAMSFTIDLNMMETCSAPTNIAVIKYWGKDSVEMNTPLNSSVSCTLDQVCHHRFISLWLLSRYPFINLSLVLIIMPFRRIFVLSPPWLPVAISPAIPSGSMAGKYEYYYYYTHAPKSREMKGHHSALLLLTNPTVKRMSVRVRGSNHACR